VRMAVLYLLLGGQTDIDPASTEVVTA
jgi:hypothetical protein